MLDAAALESVPQAVDVGVVKHLAHVSVDDRPLIEHGNPIVVGGGEADVELGSGEGNRIRRPAQAPRDILPAASFEGRGLRQVVVALVKGQQRVRDRVQVAAAVDVPETRQQLLPRDVGRGVPVGIETALDLIELIGAGGKAVPVVGVHHVHHQISDLPRRHGIIDPHPAARAVVKVLVVLQGQDIGPVGREHHRRQVVYGITARPVVLIVPLVNRQFQPVLVGALDAVRIDGPVRVEDIGRGRVEQAVAVAVADVGDARSADVVAQVRVFTIRIAAEEGAAAHVKLDVAGLERAHVEARVGDAVQPQIALVDKAVARERRVPAGHEAREVVVARVKTP